MAKIKEACIVILSKQAKGTGSSLYLVTTINKYTISDADTPVTYWKANSKKHVRTQLQKEYIAIEKSNNLDEPNIPIRDFGKFDEDFSEIYLIYCIGKLV